MRVCIVLACALMVGPVCLAAEQSNLVFSNDAQEVTLSTSQGSVVSIRNKLTGEDYGFAVDEIWIELSDCIVGSYLHPARLTQRTASSCAFAGAMSGLSFTRSYSFPAGRSYFNRAFSIRNDRQSAIVVKRIVDGSFVFSPAFGEAAFHTDGMDRMDPGTEMLTETSAPSLYQTAVNVFLRSGEGGLFVGLKYPYFKPVLTSSRVAMAYDVNVRLKPGETLELPEMFCGAYANTGFSVRKDFDWTPRVVIPEQEIMDVAEVRGVRQVIRDYLPEYKTPWPGYAIWLNSWWAHPDLRGRLGAAQVEAYRKLLEEAKAAGCVDSVLVAPVWLGWAGFLEPCEEMDSVGDSAEFPLNKHISRLLDESRAVNLPIWGFCEPNAYTRHPRKDRPDWKLQPTPDPRKRLIQNCHANPAYEDWFLRLIESTLNRTGIPGWAWDHCWVRRPMICYDTSHGHEAGNCEFQQYRNVTGMIGKLRDSYPNDFFEIYWGLKEAGTWGLRGLNSLENAYENNSPAPPGMTAADDLRFQHWYNHNYRFIPTYMNLAQINDRKEKNGLQYSILSCLSASTHASLTDWTAGQSSEEAARSFATLRRWKLWATRNLDYLRDRTDLFGQPCRKDGIDGTAHVIGDRGYIFVFNPTGRERAGSVPLDGMIGLTGGPRYRISEISGESAASHGVWARGDEFRFSIAARSALLFAIEPCDDPPGNTQPEVTDPQPAFRP